MTLKVALLQIDIAFGDPQANIKKAEKWIEKAANQKVDLIMLPEMWTTGYDLARLHNMTENTVQSLMSRLAKVNQVNIMAGSVAKREGAHIYNTSFVYDRKGTLISEYKKVHLFRLMEEEKYLAAGHTKGEFQLEGIPAATVICYDIRFPEWIRAHTLSGARLLFVPAEWPAPRLDHWRTLLQSRAIENQCFVIACNRVGEDPKNVFAGHSLIIDPWGNIIAEGSDQEELIIEDIDPMQVEEVRKMIPIYEDRRPELYF
ncbi:hydrolase [Pullulanibacillus camelliae]|uniref:Hydrolase n=1 Tax=Pullulanibacillus camelliae TaxID=1707096 RepID=A0A8J2VPR3_9BACL|nr:carbon-nitrogen family hydrolase [Pullulanibacillus camelliae]GGE36682.1 hydrolase [Pullulanibacillus camelliae]